MAQHNGLVFVHLSDIHFHPDAHGPGYDLNADIRRKLLQDAAAVVGQVGAPSAVLISGDIGYAGKPADYALATQWLGDLCTQIGASSTSVCCVPGNHDVDRDAIAKRSMKDARKSLRTCKRVRIDDEIRDYLDESEVFYSPLESFNEFAARWDCHCTKDQPVWRRPFDLDGSSLVVHGLNSTLVSAHDDSDAREATKLVLGRHQYAILDEGDIHVVLCHHPFGWLRDGEKAEEVLNARAHLQLFGHKHRQRLTAVDKTLRLTAGAVGPCTREPEWIPRYNWLGLRLVESHGQRRLELEVWPRVWSEAEQRFIADSNSCSGRTSAVYPLERCGAGILPKPDVADPPAIEKTGVVEMLQAAPTGRDAMESSRILAHRYFSLTYVQKMEIAQQLGLFSDDDCALAGIDLFLAHLRRAKERNLLEQLWSEVQLAHGDGLHHDNPYRKSE
jgi:predicted MPP superfamily phosphohydrolase